MSSVRPSVHCTSGGDGVQGDGVGSLSLIITRKVCYYDYGDLKQSRMRGSSPPMRFSDEKREVPDGTVLTQAQLKEPTTIC